MKNIVIARIDERLIHGQVATQWLNFLNASVICVADDATVNDVFMNMILKAACPKKCELKVLSAEDAADYLLGEDENEKVFLITKGPQAMKVLLDKGVELPEIILGNMAMGPGRKMFNRNVAASAEEIQCFRDITQSGVKIWQQMVPTDKRVDIEKLLK